MVSERDRDAKERRVFPSEARERLTSYKARLSVKISWTVNGGERQDHTRECGMLPVMVRVSARLPNLLVPQDPLIRPWG